MPYNLCLIIGCKVTIYLQIIQKIPQKFLDFFSIGLIGYYSHKSRFLSAADFVIQESLDVLEAVEEKLHPKRNVFVWSLRLTHTQHFVILHFTAFYFVFKTNILNPMVSVFEQKEVGQ